MENKDKKIDKSKLIADALTISLGIILAVVFLAALYVVIKPSFFDEKSSIKTTPEMSKNLSLIEEAINKVSNDYIDNVDKQKLIEGAISGVAAATGDPYTRYMPEDEYQKMLVSGSETYGGIGVHITYDKENNGIMVLGIMPNSPAFENDLKAGDIIKKVDDLVISMETYMEGVDSLKGEENTQVVISIVRNGEMFEKKITRKKIATNNIESKILDGNIGYIKIWSFDNEIYKQFSDAYNELKIKNISGLVIDVRNNPGGLVSDTVKIAQLLLPKCDILKLVYKDSTQKVYKCDGKNEIKIPLAVLANSRSASASEILASAIKDSNKGVIIGSKTYGKGIVQTIEPLGGNGALSITTSKYYTASGVEIHKNGIEPNILVELPEDVKFDMTIPQDKDTQLQKAIEYIKTK
ncbi:MAG: S41 family peptidase [Clostridia bacterium]